MEELVQNLENLESEKLEFDQISTKKGAEIKKLTGELSVLQANYLKKDSENMDLA
jgi:hypothetical protein